MPTDLFGHGSRFKEINISHDQGLKRDPDINRAIPQMTPMSKIEEATIPMVTIGSLDAQDSIRYIMDNPEKTEDQAKRNQELVNHLMQKIRQMEQHDRSKGEDGLLMEPCAMTVLVCNVLIFDVLLLAIFII